MARKILIHQPRRRLAIFVILLALGLAFFGREYEKLVNSPVSAWVTEPKADCGVVLTGGAGRIKEGFDLLSHKAIRKLIIAGVRGNTSVREIMPMLPFYGEIKEEDVFVDRRSGTTYGNAQQALPIVEALHCRDLVLVTSSLHMARAYATFRAAFPERLSIYKHSIVASLSETSPWEVSYEALKTIFYAIWAY